MTNSYNSRKGRKKSTPSRQLCSCHDINCNINKERGKHKLRKSRRQR